MDTYARTHVLIDGTHNFESTPNEGTRMECYLPRRARREHSD